MAARILHLLDGSTPPEAVESLALIMAGSETEHFVAALGHRSTAALLERAGVPADSASALRWLPSRGWADPTGWRALRRLLAEIQPTHLHAWGIAAGVAAAMCDTPIQRIVTLAEVPSSASRAVLRIIDRGGFHGPGPGHGTARWVVMAGWIGRELSTRAIDAARITHIPPGIVRVNRRFDRAAIREDLGLLPEDGPVLLMAAEGGTAHSRHDYGLWVGGILQQIFPRIRVLIREDQRGRQNHGLERLLDDLPDGEVPVVASAHYSWEELLAVADVSLLTADGRLAAGSLLRAMAAGVPVVGTPVDVIQEWIEDGRNGLIARELKPRAIAARVEELFADADLRARLTATARQDIADRFSVAEMLDRYEGVFADARVVTSDNN